MEYVQGKPRSQIVLIESSLEEMIEHGNPVRIIDLFVDRLNFMELGFTHSRHAREGRLLHLSGGTKTEIKRNLLSESSLQDKAL